jgi:hypothetical protein
MTPHPPRPASRAASTIFPPGPDAGTAAPQPGIGSNAQPSSASQLSKVHAFPSSQVTGSPTHMPAPSQMASSLQASMSGSLQLLPKTSKAQTAEQQSPFSVPPSSQSSPGLTIASPQTIGSTLVMPTSSIQIVVSSSASVFLLL